MKILRNLFGSKEIVVIKNENAFKKAYNQGLYIVPKYAVVEQNNPNLRTTFNKKDDSFAKFTDDLKGKVEGIFYASQSKEKVFNLNELTIQNMQ